MSIDPEILLGLQNSRQNQSSIDLQRQILDMQTLQVMNQVRMSKGLPPLTELPAPPPKPENTRWKKNPVFGCVLFIILASPVLFFFFLFLFGLLRYFFSFFQK